MREHMLISIIAMVGFYGLITIYQDMRHQPRYARTYIKHHWPNDKNASTEDVEEHFPSIHIVPSTSSAVNIRITDLIRHNPIIWIWAMVCALVSWVHTAAMILRNRIQYWSSSSRMMSWSRPVEMSATFRFLAWKTLGNCLRTFLRWHLKANPSLKGHLSRYFRSSSSSTIS